ncbi:hypothetical protein O3P69_012057 [Scylla paramamosain]|uniref:Uncharacterized protein n=2 Tax=Scylla paramamosain TaxID=85552 RepID=A0AAW0SI46_SCYPA
MYLQDATFPGTVAIPVSSGSSLLTFALKLLHKLIITVPVPYDAAEGTDATTTTATTATTRVIRVGNMLQVLPQDASAPQPHFPMIVQAGNVIQVVPADNTQVLGAEVVGVGRVMQVVGVPGFPPTPAPDPCPSHPLPVTPAQSSSPLLPPCGAASGGDGRWRWATHTWVSCGLAYLPPQQQIPRINEDMLVSEEGEGPSSDAEDEVLFREAMSEVPVVGSPVPEYEVEEEKEEEDEEEARIRKKKRLLPVALPPADKGILRSPSYRFVRCKELAQEASEAV